MQHTISKLILTVGGPLSGKTTWALQQNAPVVNPECLRSTLYACYSHQPEEREVWRMVGVFVETLFRVGHPVVVVDYYNMFQSQRNKWIEKGNRCSRTHKNWQVFYKDFTCTGINECYARADRLGKSNLHQLIDSINRELEPLSDEEQKYRL